MAARRFRRNGRWNTCSTCRIRNKASHRRLAPLPNGPGHVRHVTMTSNAGRFGKGLRNAATIITISEVAIQTTDDCF